MLRLLILSDCLSPPRYALPPYLRYVPASIFDRICQIAD